LIFAHRFFAALDIFARAAADMPRFLLPVELPLFLPLKSFSASSTVSNCCCVVFKCCRSFDSSAFNAAKMSIKSSGAII
jgi:hypothetical protein